VTALPAPTTSISGRADLLAHVKDLLWDPDVRLVTLLGPGGIGKTRLAVAVAWELHDSTGFDDGVAFVDLSAVQHADLVPATVARALGIADGGAGELWERLEERLGPADLLVVLDNFEQVLDAAPFVARLLAASRRAAVLVTSRRALNLRGEQRVEVPPLAPEDAVALFAVRARAVNPRFELGPSTAPAVAALCRDLDRVPLAIELAAARSALLSPAALHERLGRDPSVLGGGPTDQPERLRSMHAAIAWSYDALPDAVRALFRRLSVFAGGWTLDAAAVVCAAPGGSALDGHAVLIDHHLIQRDDTAGDARFRMLETVREFARTRFEADATDAVATHRRHARTVLDQLTAAQPGLSSADQVEWLDRLDADHHNLRAALRWALRHDPATAAALAGTAWRFWLLRGYAHEGLDWLEQALAVAPDASSRRPDVLLGAGSMREAIGDDDGAAVHYRAALAELEARQDPAGCATACRHLGNAALGQARYDEAAAWYERARVTGTELGDRFTVAGAVANLGSVAYFRGDLAAAERHWSAAASYFRDERDVIRLTAMLNNLAELATARGDPDRAVTLHEEVLVLRQQVRDPIGLAQTMANLGRAVQAAGDLPRARALLEEALTRLRDLGVRRDTGSCLYHLALLDRAEGRTTEAVAHAGECLTIKRDTNERFDLAQCLELLAGLATDHGHSEQADKLVGAASTIRREVGARPFTEEPESAATLESVIGLLGPVGLRAAMDEGATWTLPRALAEATELVLVGAPTAPEPAVPELVGMSPEARRLGLTARELEILGYLARRYTDREIADTLTISLRTVTTHVSRILTKLGVDGRRQAATAAARLGLVAS
jgi:predicted ATPase/DNA-binding CsgD family transcriptional regulator